MNRCVISLKFLYFRLAGSKERVYDSGKGRPGNFRSSKVMYVWRFLATIGFLAACIFLIIHGLKFNSKYLCFILAEELYLSLSIFI